MTIFPRQQRRFIRRQFIMLAAAAVSAYAQSASPPENPAAGSAASVNDISAMSGSVVRPVDSASSVDTLTVPAEVTIANSATTADTTAQPAPLPDSAVTQSVTAPPPATSNHYYGPAAVYTGPGRGMISQQPTGRTVRTRVIDTTAPPIVDSARNTAAAGTDSLPTQLSKAGSDTAGPAPAYKAPRTAKIVAALVTTTAIGCLTAFILAGKLSGADNENRQRIPDPPPPPGY